MTRSTVENRARVALAMGALGALLATFGATSSASAQACTPVTSVPPPPSAFPPDSAFVAVGCFDPGAAPSFDSCTDLMQRDHRNIVGGGDRPAYMQAQDGTYLYLRLRLEDDPRAPGGGMASFGWGFGLDSNANGRFEAYVSVIGTGNPSNDRVEILDQDTGNGTTCNLTGATALRPISASATTGTWVRVTPAPPLGMSFCPDRPATQNYHLTVAVPLSVLAQYGALGATLAYAGTSSNSTGIQNDFVCQTGSPATCTSGATCPSGVCLLPTGYCAPPIDSFFLGCVTTDGNGDGIDDGCVAATPYCIVGVGTSACVACRTAADCTAADECSTTSCSAGGTCAYTPIPAGAACSGGFCNGSATAPACAPCLDDASGAGTDTGCSASSPYCDTSRATPVCVQCLGAVDCDDANECTLDACVDGACEISSRTPGAACSDGVCDGAASAPLCLACIDDVSGSGVDSGCGAGAPFCDTSGAAPVCTQCLGAADCNDGNTCTTDSCVAGTCLNVALGAGSACPGGICDGAPVAPLCLACIDTAAGSGVDAGCSASAPFCDTSGAAPVCAQCLGAADCNDGNDCTTDTCVAGACVLTSLGAGSTCSAGVCDGAATSPLCQPCVDSAGAGGVDAGCSVGTPLCDTSGAAPVCVQCLGAADCDDGNECTTDACTAGSCVVTSRDLGSSCAGGVCDGATSAPVCVTCLDTTADGGVDAGCSGASPFCDTSGSAPVCAACLTAAQCDDANECTTDACVAGACVLTSRTIGTSCASGVCDGASSDPACVTCVDDADPGAVDSGCSAETALCDTSGAAPVCVSCRSDADCSDGNECTTDACTAGACSVTALDAGTPCSAGICDINTTCSAVAVSITVPEEGEVVTTPTPTVSGTATPGQTVTVSIDGAELGTVTAGSDGSWSIALTTPLDDGPHTVIATVSTDAGDATDSSSFVVDATTSVTITSPSDESTSTDATPDIRGTGEPGATVVVTLDGAEIGTATVEPDGTWVVLLTEPLMNGPHTISATATDGSGNTATDEVTFTVDANTDIVITEPANESVTNDPTPILRGTAVPGATIVITMDGEEIGTVTADEAGEWELPVGSPLADGAHVVVATATDPAGNVASDSATFTVDTRTEVVIVSVTPAGVVTGTGEPGSTVVVTIDGVQVGTVTVGEDGAWSLDTGTPLSPGTHTVTATSTDPAGNTATDTTDVVVEGPPDGGLPVDAGSPPADGGVDTDAGPPRGGFSGGALCAVRPGTRGGAAAGLLLFGLAALLFVRRRR